MPRQKSGNFDQNKYVVEYLKKNIKLIQISLNKTKKEDVEIIEWLKSKPAGASAYIKHLIREDIKKENK